MDLAELLELLRQVDARLSIRGDQLGIDHADRISDEIRSELRRNKAALLLAVKNAPARLVRLAIVAGIHEQGCLFTSAEIRKLQRESDLQDCINCSIEELQAWASALAIRAARHRGKRPRMTRSRELRDESVPGGGQTLETERGAPSHYLSVFSGKNPDFHGGPDERKIEARPQVGRIYERSGPVR